MQSWISSGNRFDFTKKVYIEYIQCKLFLFKCDQNSIHVTLWEREIQDDLLAIWNFFMQFLYFGV
jgi:hypothetical protein